MFVLTFIVLGTGIFTAPSTVIIGTGSPAVALIFWAVGGIYALAASHMYIDFGLNIPKHVVDSETMPESRKAYREVAVSSTT